MPRKEIWTDGVLVEVIEPTPQELQIEINSQALAYLAETDWYVSRFAETGTPIPESVKAKRQAARDSVVN